MQDDIFDNLYCDNNIFGKTLRSNISENTSDNTDKSVNLKPETIDSKYNKIKIELVGKEVKELKGQMRPCINGKIITECTFLERNRIITLLNIPKNFSLTLNTKDGKKTFNNIHSFETDENDNITIKCEEIKRYFKPTREFFKNGNNIKSRFTKKNNKLVMSIKQKYKNKYCSNIQNKIKTQDFINKYKNSIKNIKI